jgi:aspartate beta-hydroxylase
VVAPPDLRNLAKHAAAQLHRAQAGLLEEALQPVRTRHGDASLARVHAAIEIYLGLRKPEYLDPLQRPSFLYLPGIQPRAFFERGDIAWLSSLEAATDYIRTELQAVLAKAEDLAPYVQIPEGQDPMQWRELNRSRQWSSLHIIRSGAWVAESRARCPRTAAVLATLPLPNMTGHAPEALYSVLQPDTHIPPHHGLANYKLVAHLPLIVPDSCAIRVGSETRGWREGECLVFDDSFEHEAWNRSTAVRAVLILDIWNPQLSAAERDGIAAIVSAIGAFRRGYCTPA